MGSKKLTENEFKLICDYCNGKIVKLEIDASLWERNLKFDFISGMVDSINYRELDKKWEVDGNKLVQKLDLFNYKEFIQLIIDIDNFWSNKETNYTNLGYITPSSIMSSIIEMFNQDVKLGEVALNVQFLIGTDNQIWMKTNFAPKGNKIAIQNVQGEIIWLEKETKIILIE